MYIGATDGSGVLNMLLELMANATDQHLAGRCTRASIEIESDGTITMDDDGPGLSAEGSAGLPPLHEMLTRFSYSPTVDGHRPHVHLGVGGMGLFIVNALSERFELRSVRDGTLTTIAYSRGEVIQPLNTASTDESSGTRIRFRADPDIFKYPRVPRTELTRQLEDLSFLSPGLALSWKVAGDDLAAGGLRARVALGVPCDAQDVATHKGTYSTAKGPIDIEVALAWCVEMNWNGQPVIDSFVNLARTRSHGSHVDGLLHCVRTFFEGHKDCDRGLFAAVSVMLADVKYGQPERHRLEMAEVIEPVAAATTTALEEWARRRPAVAAQIRVKFAK
jgi:DNA gyrase subunit B